MGYTININGRNCEVNDTLAISKKEGFPEYLNYKSFVKNTKEVERGFLGYTGTFLKEGFRQFPENGTPAFLVQKTDKGKWLYWGESFNSYS